MHTSRSTSRLLPLTLLSVVALLGVACGDSAGSSARDAPLQVVTTTTVLTDFALVIGGDRVGVYGVMKPNVDAHDYEPSARDLDAMRSAQVIVRNGVDLEAWFEDAATASGTKATVVDASTGITIRSADDHGDDDHEEHEGDPHIWHDPRNAKQMVATMLAAFVAADPAGSAIYEANAARYTAELDALDAEIEAKIATLANKKLVTNHDAFGYYVERYGLEFVGSIIPSFESSAEVSAAELDDLVDEIETQGVKAVFAESSLPSKVAKTIADEAGIKVVDGEGALYGDGLGAAKSPGGTYLGMMRHNTATIVDNLG
ncbi:MAG TPA: metal ABC transporter substrate-binding protein [Acidimicrobiales bacterium]|nr:metal ABC transporter substrate-binding protein [Acidimicrobiales bacterium]